MQLKRDTEYALRIMICMAEYMKENGKKAGIPSFYVITKAGIPMLTFKRVIRNLEEKNMIREKSGKEGEKFLYPGQGFWDQSILSIGEAAEGNMQIFAIFDKNSYLVRTYGNKLREAQDNLDHMLSEITLDYVMGENIN